MFKLVLYGMLTPPDVWQRLLTFLLLPFAFLPLAFLAAITITQVRIKQYSISISTRALPRSTLPFAATKIPSGWTTSYTTAWYRWTTACMYARQLPKAGTFRPMVCNIPSTCATMFIFTMTHCLRTALAAKQSHPILCTASAVLLDPKIAASGSWIFSDKVTGKEAFTAPDDTTFRIQLKEPFPAAVDIAYLADRFCYPARSSRTLRQGFSQSSDRYRVPFDSNTGKKAK